MQKEKCLDLSELDLEQSLRQERLPRSAFEVGKAATHPEVSKPLFYQKAQR